MTAPAREKSAGVSSIELFFDLVFVFVITQVTQRVEHAHGTMDFLRALLVLVIAVRFLGAVTALILGVAGERKARWPRSRRWRSPSSRSSSGWNPARLEVFFAAPSKSG